MKFLHRIMCSPIWRCSRGVTAVEYGIWAGVFVIAIFAGIGAVADMLEVAFNSASDAIAASMPENDE